VAVRSVANDCDCDCINETDKETFDDVRHLTILSKPDLIRIDIFVRLQENCNIWQGCTDEKQLYTSRKT